jgi:hypothetical protein
MRITRTSHAAGGGPEYESAGALGAQCGIDDLEAIAEGSYRFAEKHGAPSFL